MTKEVHSKWGLSPQIALGMALGVLLGFVLPPAFFKFGDSAKLVIGLIKGIATPLLFLSIVLSIVRADVTGRAALRMLGFVGINSALAMTIGLFLSNVFRPGRSLVGAFREESREARPPVSIDLSETLASYVPDGVVRPFVDNAVIPAVVLALLFGFALRRLKASEGVGASLLEEGAAAMLSVVEIVLSWVTKLVPLVVFAVVGKTIADHGLAPFAGLGYYLLVGLVGLTLHVLIVYQAWIRFFLGRSLREFWGIAKEPVVYAAGANSSLATLPLTLRALDRLGVSKGASALGACVGTNLNNDGILLYEGMAVLFVAQAHGIELTLGQQISASFVALLAAMGVAGVPEAGFVSLAVVLGTVGLPVELLPLLLSVDWVVARARSVTNVLSDMVLSMLIEGRKHA